MLVPPRAARFAGIGVVVLALVAAAVGLWVTPASAQGAARADVPALSINDARIFEGRSGTVLLTFAVTLSSASTSPVTINYATADGTARSAQNGVFSSDYVNSAGSVTFLPGMTLQPLTVPVRGDDVFERTESFFVNVTAPAGIDVADGQGVGTIDNDDVAPSLTVSDATSPETPGSVMVTVTRTGPTELPSDFTIATRDGTATASSAGAAGTPDYVPLTLGASIPASGTASPRSQMFSVRLQDDDVYEETERFEVVISAAVDATISDSAGTVTIVDDDPAPSISVDDVSVSEAAGTAVFTVTRTGASALAHAVSFATADLTAVSSAGGPGTPDYTATSGTLGFAPSATRTATRTVTVPIVDDTVAEPTERFRLSLSSPTNGASLAVAGSAATIIDDDAAPTLSINDVSKAEGDSGTTDFSFTVSLSAPSTDGVAVSFTTANGTALAGNDFATRSSSVSFLPGQTSRTVIVPVVGDTVFENDQTFFVDLFNATGAALADGQGLGTIVNDDAAPTLSVSNVEQRESGTFSFVVERVGATELPAIVSYATADGAAVSAPSGPGTPDFAATSGTLTIAPSLRSSGEATFVVPVTDDSVFELTESFRVNLSNPSGATIADGQGAGIITDDDPAPTLSVDDVAASEGDGTARFTVTRTGLSAVPAYVLYNTADGTAVSTSGELGAPDYSSRSGLLTFPTSYATTQTQQVVVPIVDDTVTEPTEQFVLNLSAPASATLADAQGIATITDDDANPTISIDDVTNPEGNAGTSTSTFTVSLSAASAQTITVNYATTDGFASSGSDYLAASGTLTFAPGQTSRIVAVTVSGDTTYEIDETFFVNLTGATNATIVGNPGVGTIGNDDAAPTLTVDDPAVSEVDGSVTFTVTRTGASQLGSTVAYATADGTAVAAATGPGTPDYTATSGTLTFAGGVANQTRTVVVPISDDAVYEGTEQFALGLSNPQSATILDGQGVATITDDDTAPTVTIDDRTVSEGAGTVSFTVTRTGASALPIAVSYATANGTAVSGPSGPGTPDFTASSGTLTFSPGSSAMQTLQVVVPVVDDLVAESTEQFAVNLFGTSNGASLADAQGIATITDDDADPMVSIDDVSSPEGNAGTTSFTFTVSLFPESAKAVTVDYETSDGTATAGSDYTATSGTVTFAPGQTSRTVTVQVAGDTTYEDDQTFAVRLTHATNVTVLSGVGIGTISNDDAAPRLTVDDPTVSEADGSVTFTVSRSGPTELPTTVSYDTEDGTATATEDGPGTPDYTATSDLLAFPASSEDQDLTVTVPINDDTTAEPEEAFTLGLSAPVHGTIVDGIGLATIVDDDADPALSIDDVTAAEGDSGTTTFTFTVSLSAPSARPVSVGYATSDDTAVHPTDFAATSGTLAFVGGQTSRTVTVEVAGDTVSEYDERFFVDLSEPVHASIDDGRGAGTIVDDDELPAVSVGDVTDVEGDAGTTSYVFDVSLSTASDRPVSVDYATEDGTATAGEDYDAAAGTLSFEPGQTEGTVALAVRGDLLDEDDETFVLVLSSPSNATVVGGPGTGTITDDDALPEVSVGDAEAAEGDTGTTPVAFPVTLSSASGRTVSVDFATVDGSADAGTDYVVASGTLTIAAGETRGSITVDVRGDELVEPDETFTLELSEPANAAIAGGTGMGTITDDDAAPVAAVGAGHSVYVEDAAPVLVAPDILITDADGDTLLEAQVSIARGLRAGQDRLVLVRAADVAPISASCDGGVLVLAAPEGASVELFQQALRSVAYVNSSQDPATRPRSVEVVVDDGTNESDAVEVSVRVRGRNDAPAIARIPRQVVVAGRPSAPIAITLSDPDDPARGIRLAVTSFDGTLVRRKGVTVSGGTAHRTLRITPTAGVSGLVRILVRASDPHGASTTRTFVVQVRRP